MFSKRKVLYGSAAGCLAIGMLAMAIGLATPGARAANSAATPTFNKDIAPIVFKQCSSCHRPGEVAPFSLLTYRDFQKRAPMIASVTASRRMPPWKAESHGEFIDERRLSAEELDLIKRWADSGAPEGNAADLPPAPKFTDGWQLGPPDAVFEPSEGYTLGAEGKDVYRCFVIPTNFSEDRYFSAVEVRPGNRGIVHHVLGFLDTSGAAKKLDAADTGPGYSTFGGVGFLPSGGIGGWAPGNTPRRLPEGVGNLLPKGADIVLQVHYHKSGKQETDQTKIGVYFSKGPVEKRVRLVPVLYRALRIPPGDANYTVQAAFPIPVNMTALGVTPHMHLLGKEMTVTATLPGGDEKRLVRVPDWDFNWQTSYWFKEPVKLAAGSRISLTARYDNSEKNPANPSHPPKMVTWGEETTDEMCIAFVHLTADGEKLTAGAPAPGGRLQRLRQLFGRGGDRQ